jgi:Fe2+ or Zn2+ uptake regulation protein
MQENEIHSKVNLLPQYSNPNNAEGRKQLTEILYQSKHPLSLLQILDALEKSCDIDRIAFTSDVYCELSESFLEHHHYLICSRCDTVMDVELSATAEQVVG